MIHTTVQLASLAVIRLVGLTSHYVTQRGKIAKNTVYACALLSAQADTHSTKGKKGMISRMSDQVNNGLNTRRIIQLHIRIGDRIWASPDEVTEMSDESLTSLTYWWCTCEYLDGIGVQRVDLNVQV